MSAKRKRDSGGEAAEDHRGGKKRRGGFKVGPDNLPDGTYKRKSRVALVLVASGSG